jgi:hypothetical protein
MRFRDPASESAPRSTPAPTVRALGGERNLDETPALSVLAAGAPGSATRRAANDAVRAKSARMLEGELGTLLDIDHGTYPFVT